MNRGRNAELERRYDYAGRPPTPPNARTLSLVEAELRADLAQSKGEIDSLKLVLEESKQRTLMSSATEAYLYQTQQTELARMTRQRADLHSAKLNDANIALKEAHDNLAQACKVQLKAYGNTPSLKYVRTARARVGHALKLHMQCLAPGLAESQSAYQGQGLPTDGGGTVSAPVPASAEAPQDDASKLREANKVLEGKLSTLEKENVEYIKENKRLLKELETTKRMRPDERALWTNKLNHGVAANTEDEIGGGETAGAGSGQDLSQQLAMSNRLGQTQDELQQTKSLAHDRQTELQERIANLEKANGHKTLMLQDMAEQAAQNQDQERQEMAAALYRERENHRNEVDSLEKKLKFYTKNQELLSTQADKAREQGAMISKLKDQLHAQRSARGGRRDPRDIQRIKELELQVRELGDTTNRRNPDSLSNLIRAARPSENVEARLASADSQVRRLQDELDSEREKHELATRDMKQKFDKLMLGHQEQIEFIQGQIKDSTKGLTRHTASSINRATTGGGGDQTRYWMDKVKETKKHYEKRIATLRKQKGYAEASQGGGDGLSQGGGGGQQDDLIKQQVQEIRSLKARVQQLSQTGGDQLSNKENHEGDGMYDGDVGGGIIKSVTPLGTTRSHMPTRIGTYTVRALISLYSTKLQTSSHPPLLIPSWPSTHPYSYHLGAGVDSPAVVTSAPPTVTMDVSTAQAVAKQNRAEENLRIMEVKVKAAEELVLQVRARGWERRSLCVCMCAHVELQVCACMHVCAFACTFYCV